MVVATHNAETSVNVNDNLPRNKIFVSCNELFPIEFRFVAVGIAHIVPQAYHPVIALALLRARFRDADHRTVVPHRAKQLAQLRAHEGRRFG